MVKYDAKTNKNGVVKLYAYVYGTKAIVVKQVDNLVKKGYTVDFVDHSTQACGDYSRARVWK